jgi:N-acetylglucosaminyldiphosphoundecaprenol N-acetyl-beta-D-mannosaminyltransferase
MLDDPEFRLLHALDETCVHIDGMPLVPLCRLAGVNVSAAHRVTLMDLLWPLMQLATDRGWRVFWLGSTPSVQEKAMATIRTRFPALQIAGRHGFFRLDDEDENREVVAEIQSFAPDLVLVGMGMGRQEKWILRNRHALSPASIMTVGACMEYVAEESPLAPEWMSRGGLQWLFRLLENPRRFGHRYLVEPWRVAAYILVQIFKRPASHGR